MKKIIPWILAFAVVLTFAFGVMTVHADAPEVNLELGSVSGEQGETVTVPLDVTKNDGFAALVIEITYDTNALELKGVTCKVADFTLTTGKYLLFDSLSNICRMCLHGKSTACYMNIRILFTVLTDSCFNHICSLCLLIFITKIN